MKMCLRASIRSAALLLVALPACLCPAAAAQSSPAHPSLAAPADDRIPADDLIDASQPAQDLRSAHMPLVLQVGSHVLFAQAHIPGSQYTGAAGTPEGIAALRQRVATLPRNQAIVLYCGCCPWPRCPNIHAAYDQLRQMGFTQAKVLYIPQNFGADWVDKGFPVEKGR